MALIREEDDLQALCAVAGERLGLPDGVVEKDYWVAQALRALQREFPSQFIFKGGTSLSKGYALIKRFSEDIDVLVRAQEGASRSARYKRLKRMTEAAAQAVGDGESTRLGGDDDGSYRISELNYGPETDGPAVMLPRIRLDLGVIGGIEPHGARPIGTLLGDVLSAERGIEPATYEDLALFDVSVLHPGRTLVEKLLLVHTASTRSQADSSRLGEYRAARHFYDIHCLLGHDESLELLADREQFKTVIRDAVKISDQHFGGVEPRPAGGFAASPAFAAEDPLLAAILDEYTGTMDGYYFGEEPYPSYEEVCSRVQEKRLLL